MQPDYSERIVAFIDVLGFAALVRGIAAEPTLHAKLHRVLTQIKRYKHYSMQENTAQSDLEVSVFSDSIVISGASENVHGVIWSAIHLQCGLLELGVLVRGGISRGRTFHADDVLYGEGMLDAYYLESKAAIYPRIVIHPNLLESVQPGHRAMFLTQDADGLWFIDPFSMGVLPGDSDALLERGYDPYEESLKRLGRLIDRELSRLSDVGHLAKWKWLKTQYARAVVEFEKFGQPRFWHIWKEFENSTKPTGSAVAKPSENSA